MGTDATKISKRPNTFTSTCVFIFIELSGENIIE